MTNPICFPSNPREMKSGKEEVRIAKFTSVVAVGQNLKITPEEAEPEEGICFNQIPCETPSLKSQVNELPSHIFAKRGICGRGF